MTTAASHKPICGSYEPRRSGVRGVPRGRRGVRVLLLVALVCLLSVADLVLTLIFLREVGMIEANPIARRVMGTGSPAILVGWKLGLVALASLILALARHHRAAEVGAWVAAAALLLLCVQWHRYISNVHTLTPYIEALEQEPGSNWMAMTPQ